MVVGDKAFFQRFKAVALNGDGIGKRIFLVGVAGALQQFKVVVKIADFGLRVQQLQARIGTGAVARGVVVEVIRIGNVKLAVYFPVVVGFARHGFQIFGHDVIAFAQLVGVAHKEGVGVDGVFVVGVFDGGVLMPREDFHVPQLVFIGDNNDIALG